MRGAQKFFNILQPIFCFSCHQVQTHGGFFRQNDSRISSFLQTLNTRLPFKLGSVWPQTLPKRVSDDPRHFIFQRRKNFSKLRTAVYPPNMAPIGAKLCQNAFQVIPDISFFDAKKKFDKIFWSRQSCFAFLSQFWRSDRQTDLKMKLLAIFRSRCTYSEVWKTKNWRKYALLRLGVRDI